MSISLFSLFLSYSEVAIMNLLQVVFFLKQRGKQGSMETYCFVKMYSYNSVSSIVFQENPMHLKKRDHHFKPSSPLTNAVIFGIFSSMLLIYPHFVWICTIARTKHCRNPLETTAIISLTTKACVAL